MGVSIVLGAFISLFFVFFWLQQAWFEINTLVKVRVMNGCLVLTTTDEPAG
jgi:hypothetical protein